MNSSKLMEDKRVFTNYMPNSVFNDEIKKANHFSNNEQYRKYLVNNANEIMHFNKSSFMNQNFIYVPNKEYLNIFNHTKKNSYPYLFENIYDNSKPYGYETNFTKNKYLSRQQLQQNRINKYK